MYIFLTCLYSVFNLEEISVCGDTDIEKRLVDTGEGGAESATNGDSSMETHTLPYVK